MEKELNSLETREDIESEKQAAQELIDSRNETIRKRNEEISKEEQDDSESIDEDIEELFLDSDGVAYATIRINNHTENWPIRSRQFNNYVVKQIYENLGKPPTKERVNSLISIFSAKAMYDGIREEVYLRSARIDNVIYIDIVDDKWSCIRIDKDSINLINNPPVKFRRYNHMKPLIFDLDADIKDIDLLWKYIPVKEESDKIILRPHISLLLISDIPYAIWIIYGDQGSGKSMAKKLIRLCVDPSSLKILSFPKDRIELVQQVSHHYLAFYDNVTNLSKTYSDFFCRVVTGEGFTKRELFSDDDDIIYNYLRRVGFNGINLAGQEPDFLDRSVITHLKRIKKEHRRTERQIYSDFEKDRPKITGAIFKIIQKTLGIVDEVESEIKFLPRMADYAIWCESASRILGEKPKVYLNKYFNKIESLNKEAIEANPIALCILDLINDCNEWTGTPSQLLDELGQRAFTLNVNIKQPMWPKAPNKLTQRINEIKTNLEDEDIEVDTSHDGKKRVITIRKGTVSTVSSLEKAQEVEISGGEGLKTANDNFHNAKKEIDMPLNELTVLTASNDKKDSIVRKEFPIVKHRKNTIANDINNSFLNDGKGDYN